MMTGAELRRIIAYMYGERNQGKLAEDMQTTAVTVSRWVTDFSPIGKVEERLIRLLALLHRKRIYWREAIKEKPNELDDML